MCVTIHDIGIYQKLQIKVGLSESFTSGLLETLSGFIGNKYREWGSANQKHSNKGRIYRHINMYVKLLFVFLICIFVFCVVAIVFKLLLCVKL